MEEDEEEEEGEGKLLAKPSENVLLLIFFSSLHFSILFVPAVESPAEVFQLGVNSRLSLQILQISLESMRLQRLWDQSERDVEEGGGAELQHTTQTFCEVRPLTNLLLKLTYQL